MVANNLELGLLERMPYSVMSCREFEHALGAIAEAGITDYFQGMQVGNRRAYLWPEYQAESYPRAPHVDLMRAFQTDLSAILPEAYWLKVED
jgi:hypothetical protein